MVMILFYWLGGRAGAAKICRSRQTCVKLRTWRHNS